MRVIAGKWKGRQLKSPQGQDVRPTTDRVKEALFNLLGPRVGKAVFIDLCCGAGGLGVEALSRGASRSILVDRSSASLELARANLQHCGADEGSYDLVREDVQEWLFRWRPLPEPWIVVADPPYHSGLPWAIFQELIRLRGEPGFVTAVVEHQSGHQPDWDPGGVLAEMSGIRERKYGRSVLTILARDSGSETDSPDPGRSEKV